MDNARTGALVRRLRKEQGMTQRELAERLHITDRAVSKWERGICAPDIALLEPLAGLLGISVLELIQGERRPEAGAGREPEEETRQVIEYSKHEIGRKTGAMRKKYLGGAAACLTLILLIGGALLWRSGLLFLMDKKGSPDGQSVARVYSKKWGFWPLRFTLEDSVQTILEEETPDGRVRTYVSYGDDVSYEGLWWAPDSRKYVLAVQQGEDTRCLVLSDLERHTGTNLAAVVNLYHWMTEEELMQPLDEPPKVEYQFLQWGKDSRSMLLYYSFDGGTFREGYFWYNCETGLVSGILPLDPAGG